MSTSTPLVSVVLPVFNRAHLLASAARSVLDQSYRNLELIVVDDASADDPAQAIAALGDPRAHCLRRDTNGGPAAARNTGIEAARGELIAFQDSDDEWLPGKLAAQVEALLNAPADTVMAYTDVERVAEGRRIRYPGDRLQRKSGALAEQAIHSGILFSYTQSWLVRRAALAAAGPFDTGLRRWEDWELCIRLCRQGPVVHVPRVGVVSHRVADSITNDMTLCAPALRQIIERHLPTPSAGDAGAARMYYSLARFEFLYGNREAGWAGLRRSLQLRPSAQALALAALSALRIERRLLFWRHPGAARSASTAGTITPSRTSP
jgi:glycosyltransferase involved in cell wall biosynthesis